VAVNAVSQDLNFARAELPLKELIDGNSVPREPTGDHPFRSPAKQIPAPKGPEWDKRLAGRLATFGSRADGSLTDRAPGKFYLPLAPLHNHLRLDCHTQGHECKLVAALWKGIASVW
jgi:hypothetical protein